MFFTLVASFDPNVKNYYTAQFGVDYPGNDIIHHPAIIYYDCLAECSSNPSCVGIATSFDPAGNTDVSTTPIECWLKSKFDNKVDSNIRIIDVKNA